MNCLLEVGIESEYLSEYKHDIISIFIIINKV